MFIVDLACKDGHRFEGWYDNHRAFEEARAEGLSCPLCGSGDVQQQLAFGAIGRARPRAVPPAPAPAPARSPSPEALPASPPSAGPPAAGPPARAAMTPPGKLPLEVQKALSRFLAVVRAHSEDVGPDFARHALAIHKGEEEPRPLLGTSTPDEEEALREEGVPFLKVPVPDIDQN
jgi:hypothetical protein